MAYDIRKVRARGASDEDIARYLAAEYGYDIHGPLNQGASYTDIAEYLANTDPHAVAMHFFQKRWSPEQSAGIVGNLSYESSGMNPTVLGDKKKSFGLAQWNKDRLKGLIDYAKSKGEDTPSFITQLEYVQHELETSESAAGEALRKTTTVGDSTRAFSEFYERPGKPNMDARYKRAASLLPKQQNRQPEQLLSPTGEQQTDWENMADPIAQAPFHLPNPLNATPEQVEQLRGPARVAGMIGGGVLATPANIVAPGVSTVAGAAGGAAITDQVINYVKQKVLERAYGAHVEPTLTEALVGPNPLGPEDNYGVAGAAGEGAAWEMGGQVAGKVLSKGAEIVGKAVRPVIGATTGAGTGAVEEALKSGEQLKGNIFKTQTDFDKAMRGKLQPEEIVDNAKRALNVIREKRGAEYVSKLKEVRTNPETLDGIKSDLFDKVDELASEDRFDIGFQKATGEQKIVTDPDTGLSVVEGGGPNGYKVDFSTSPIIEGRPVIKKALHDVLTWEDTSAAGLDTLKKRLSTYVSQARRGTPAHAFLTDLETSLSNSLKSEIPGYAEMTKGYSEATKLIKDIESNLMLRSEGMSGRITADQTLRRLSSAMKDNFELRHELVNALSSEGKQDIAGQIAGNLMKSPVPHGLRRVMMVPEAAAVFIKPELWPVLVSSSPRVAGEFLRLYGKALSSARGISPEVGKGLAFFFSEENRDKIKFPGAEKEKSDEK